MWKKKVRRQKEKKNPTVPQCRSVRQGLRLNSKQLEPPLPAWPGGGLLSTAAGMAEGDEERKLTWRPPKGETEVEVASAS